MCWRTAGRVGRGQPGFGLAGSTCGRRFSASPFRKVFVAKTRHVQAYQFSQFCTVVAVSEAETDFSCFKLRSCEAVVLNMYNPNNSAVFLFWLSDAYLLHYLTGKNPFQDFCVLLVNLNMSKMALLVGRDIKEYSDILSRFILPRYWPIQRVYFFLADRNCTVLIVSGIFVHNWKARL